MPFRAVGLASACALVGAVKLIDLEEGSLFTKCIKISDWETKSMEDDIELVDRDAETGCCPGATEPGTLFDLKSTSYVGPQIICGLTEDMYYSALFRKVKGVKYDIKRTGTGFKSCNFNYCFVMKQNLECANGAKQMINGCCAPKAECEENNCGFKDDCKNYVKSVTAVNYSNGRVSHCTTYHKDYKARGNEGLKLKDGKYTERTEGATSIDTTGAAPKLLTDNPRVYARCEGGFEGRTGGTVGDSTPSGTDGGAVSKGVKCTGYLSETMRNPAGAQTCTPSGQPNIDKGSRCMKMKTNELITQSCDYTPGADSICAAYGNPTACCTTPTNAKIICSGADGFTEAPEAVDFDSCSAKCDVGATDVTASGARGAAGTALIVIPIIVGTIEAMRFA